MAICTFNLIGFAIRIRRLLLLLKNMRTRSSSDRLCRRAVLSSPQRTHANALYNKKQIANGELCQSVWRARAIIIEDAAHI